MKSVKEMIGKNIAKISEYPGTEANEKIIGKILDDVTDYDWIDLYPVIDKNNIVKSIVLAEDAQLFANLEYVEELDAYRFI
jgi:ribosomal protein S25